eukprot:scaffold163332_cov20-Tisochrysis_lutea.AAC.1
MADWKAFYAASVLSRAVPCHCTCLRSRANLACSVLSRAGSCELMLGCIAKAQDDAMVNTGE